MHELAVTQSLYDMVIKGAEPYPEAKVCTVHIKMGKCYDYVPEIMQEYFAMFAEGGPAEGAKLEVEWIPTTIYCLDCEEKMESIFADRCCPKCGGRKIRVMTGKEFYIDRMEIEE